MNFRTVTKKHITLDSNSTDNGKYGIYIAVSSTLYLVISESEMLSFQLKNDKQTSKK